MAFRPRRYPQLWISCGYWTVVKWITRPRRTMGKNGSDIARYGSRFQFLGARRKLIHRESTLLITHTLVILSGSSGETCL
jgi:hypothetical protein